MNTHEKQAKWKEALRLFPLYEEIRKAGGVNMMDFAVAEQMGCDTTMQLFIIMNYSELKKQSYPKEFDNEKAERERQSNMKRKQKDPSQDEEDINASTSSRKKQKIYKEL